MGKENTKDKNIEEKIRDVLNEIRPSLQADGGDLHFVNFDKDKGVLKVEFIGMCASCPMSEITLKQGIESEVVKRIKEVREVIAI